MTEQTKTNQTEKNAKKRVLTGITTTGIPHLGNYVGAIRPAIQSVNDTDDAFFFLADYHGIIKCYDPAQIHQSTLAIAATWIACGLDPKKVVFYRQSDIPEIPELTWILNCSCSKGLMNRSHAYKASVDANLEKSVEKNAKLVEKHGESEDLDSESVDVDQGITMGLFSYPILMAADILMFNATHIPVGRDQIQHIEMARDIAGTFNHKYKELFTLPTAVVDEDTPLLTGLDGRKMSKSYGNTIPLFGENINLKGDAEAAQRKQLKKAIMQIVTTSQLPEEPKDADNCNIFEIYKAFATVEEISELRAKYQAGIGWGEAKEILYNKIDSELAPFRKRYNELMANPKELEEILQMGASKARRDSRKLLDKSRRAIGIKPLAKLKK